MAEKERRDFCIKCRKNTEYVLKKKNIQKVIRDKKYTFRVTTAVCMECGEEMMIPGILDKNVREIDEQYRASEGIVSVDDIKKLMKIYRIGKAPLSLALGFGEITVTRYIDGQVPSKEYSDMIYRALTSPVYMKKCLAENKNKIADAAYNKAMTAAEQLADRFSVSEKMLRVISYIFESLEEVTPLMLQKLLYFTQGIYLALYEKPIFTEDCQAWIHGPVFPKVYNLFRDFKYNPIEDDRFAVFNGRAEKLTVEEKTAIDLVLNTFGLYGGKVLERITHKEEPWRKARRGYGENIPSNELISKESIEKYYKAINREYQIDTEEGMNRYIREMLKNV